MAYILSLLREQQDGGGVLDESSFLEDDDDFDGDMSMIDSDVSVCVCEQLELESVTSF